MQQEDEPGRHRPEHEASLRTVASGEQPPPRVLEVEGNHEEKAAEGQGASARKQVQEAVVGISLDQVRLPVDVERRLPPKAHAQHGLLVDAAQSHLVGAVPPVNARIRAR
jgi:hypothetical protein